MYLLDESYYFEIHIRCWNQLLNFIFANAHQTLLANIIKLSMLFYYIIIGTLAAREMLGLRLMVGTVEC